MTGARRRFLWRHWTECRQAEPRTNMVTAIAPVIPRETVDKQAVRRHRAERHG
jgi:hypothetical protein